MTTIFIAQSLVRFRLFTVSLLSILLASTLAVLVQAIASDWSCNLAVAVSSTIPVLGCFFGIWMGATWLKGRRACIWFIPKLAGLVLLFALCIGIIVKMSIQQKPLFFEATQITSTDKKRLGNLLRSRNPRNLIEDQTHTLRLTRDDINLLLSWGLSLGSPNRKARVELMNNSASLAVSIGMILRNQKRYLNFILTGSPATKKRTINIKISQFRLGNLDVPQWFLKLLSPVVTSLLYNDARSKPFLDATQALTINQNFFEVTYGPLLLDTNRYREQIFGSTSAGEEVLASTCAQVENLLAFVRPDKQPEFEECFETVFSLARDRSIKSDPIIENRAGIFALGILLGHPQFEEFLGPVHAGRDMYSARRALSQVELRDRTDWTKHFCLAAAITLLSDEAVSHSASVLKEDIDANKNSGFSFSDLLMGQTGTMFAVKATQNKMLARSMQERIVNNGFRIEDFVPQAADLPEDITDAELQSQYGGIGGEGYSNLIEEVERRISLCAGYHGLQ
jgi:hypothetical protein